jgi:hypothetical protein
MHSRHMIGLVLSILTVPVLVLGLLDPVEGGVAMLVAGLLILLTFAVSRVAVPRLEWIPWLTSVAAGASALAAVPHYYPLEPYPWWVWALVVVYEVAVAVTVAGGVAYVVRHVRTLRRPHAPVAA